MFEKPQDMEQETWERLHRPDAERASWIMRCVEAGHYPGDSHQMVAVLSHIESSFNYITEDERRRWEHAVRVLKERWKRETKPTIVNDVITSTWPVSRSPVLTRRDCDPGEPWPECVRRQAIAGRAHERHQSRIDAVVRAATDAVFRGEAREHLEPAECRLIAVMIRLECHHCGWSTEGTGPRGSTWAPALGHGRRGSVDGPAWSAAIIDAYHSLPTGGERIGPDDVHALLSWVVGDDVQLILEYAEGQAYAAYKHHGTEGLTEAQAWSGVAEAAQDRLDTEGGEE